jgi:hypothetical protein
VGSEKVNVRVDIKAVEQLARDSHTELYEAMKEKFPGRADAHVVAVRAAELAILLTGLADPADVQAVVEDFNKVLGAGRARHRLVPLS